MNQSSIPPNEFKRLQIFEKRVNDAGASVEIYSESLQTSEIDIGVSISYSSLR
jgi:hypothetical protein